MKLPVMVRCKTLTLKALMKVYNLDEVKGYCSHCGSYNKNYSCPEFAFNERKYLSEYKYVTLVLTEIHSDELRKSWPELKSKPLMSPVYQRYMSDASIDYEPVTAFSMLIFNKVKDQVSELLFKMEDMWPGSLSSPAGNCTKCIECMKMYNEPCLYPEKLRFSLEALGFLVSDIITEHFDSQLQWSKKGLPDVFYTCSALFSKHSLEAQSVKDVLNKDLMYIEVP